MSRQSYLFIAALLASVVTGCETVENDEGTEPTEVGPASAVEYRGVNILATVERPNRGIVHFFESDKGLGVGCDELIPADGEAAPALSADDPRDCLALFLDLTGDDVPVPAALAASSTADGAVSSAAHRPLVDALREPIASVERASAPGLDPMGGSKGTTARSCSTATQTYFETYNCDFSGGSGVIHYCDSGQWYDLYRTSAGSGRHNSFAEVQSCTPIMDVIHEYWNGTSWVDVYESAGIPENYYNWSRWEGAAAWQRRVHAYRGVAAGYFRAHTVFYND